MLDAHFALQDQKLLGDLSQLEVFVNGAFCRAEDAKISVWDHGLLYGDGIFEGIRAYQGGVFKLNAHLSGQIKRVGRLVSLCRMCGQKAVSGLLFQANELEYQLCGEITVVPFASLVKVPELGLTKQ